MIRGFSLAGMLVVLPVLGWSAAEGAGQAESLYSRADSYFFGRGVKQSCVEAVKWYEKAAKAGHSGAMARIGEIYFVGRCVKKDAAKAAKWFHQAAGAGQASAMTNLGFMFEVGDGVAQDYGEALAWYRKAAERGDTQAMINAGNLYRLGRGVPQDNQEAYRWFRLGAGKGDARALEAARGVEGSLSKEQSGAVDRGSRSDQCRSLERCDPGCYRGKPYCQKVCTANVGRTSCFDDCAGEEFCAMPGYDPFGALNALDPKQRDSVFSRKSFVGGSLPAPTDLGEGLNPSLK